MAAGQNRGSSSYGSQLIHTASTNLPTPELRLKLFQLQEKNFSMGKKKELSHEEIWDDSALIASWDEALEEYNHYHSLHARGEKVEDILNAYETAELNGHTGTNADDLQTPEADMNIMEDGEIEDEDMDLQVTTKIEDESHPTAKGDEEQLHAAAAPTVPQALANSVHDENLKNLMMSWYYAGYYTGFYEGQQQAQQQSNTSATDAPRQNNIHNG